LSHGGAGVWVTRGKVHFSNLINFNFSTVENCGASARADTPKPSQNRMKFWKYRPFSRVVKNWTAEKTVRNYIQLNEKEARGEIPYSKDRLKGLTPEQIQELWE
jgi:hypothetical protein